MRCRVGIERGRVQDDGLGLVHLDLVGRCRDEHGAGKQHMPRALADQTQRQAVLGVGAGEGVQHKQLAAVAEVGSKVAAQHIVVCWLDGLVGAPPHAGLGAGLLYGELVLGGTTRVGCRVHQQWTALTDHAFITTECVLVELFRCGVPVDGSRGRNAV